MSVLFQMNSKNRM